MSFRPPSARILRWQSLEEDPNGIEHLEIVPREDSIVASGVVIGTQDGARYGLTYKLVIDGTWRVKEASFRTTAGNTLLLTRLSHGWVENGQARPDLGACTDIDIQASPLTNILPIRRLGLKRDESAAIDVVYIQVPTLKLSARSQRYTALEPGSLYRFESLASGFTADLPVDEEGFVRDYPGVFKRLV